MAKTIVKNKTTKVVKNKSGSTTTYSKSSSGWKASGFSHSRGSKKKV